jgi:hypothetical protein
VTPFLTSLMGQAPGPKRRPAPAGKSSRRVRPALEVLESRETPTALLLSALATAHAPTTSTPAFSPVARLGRSFNHNETLLRDGRPRRSRRSKSQAR